MKKPPKHIDFIGRVVKSFANNAKTVFDIPCGDERISMGLIEKEYDVAGVDVSPKYIEKARGKSPITGRFIVGDM